MTNFWRVAGGGVALLALVVLAAAYVPGGFRNRHEWLSEHPNPNYFPSVKRVISGNLVEMDDAAPPPFIFMTIEIDKHGRVCMDICLKHGEMRVLKCQP